jgi:hypothetical protein
VTLTPAGVAAGREFRRFEFGGLRLALARLREQCIRAGLSFAILQIGGLYTEKICGKEQ